MSRRPHDNQNRADSEAGAQLASNGRLAPFVQRADDHGLDLIVLDKLTRPSVAIQVKSAIARTSCDTVPVDVRKLNSPPPRRILDATA